MMHLEERRLHRRHPHLTKLFAVLAITVLGVTACEGTPVSVQVQTPPLRGPDYEGFGSERRVEIRGYDDHVMEPFISRDGEQLLFNDLNQPPTSLHHARRIDDLTFQYEGKILGANTSGLEGTPTADRDGKLYFVSSRSYGETFSMIYWGDFAAGRLTNAAIVPGVSLGVPGEVNFDVEISPDGQTLYFVDSWFGRKGFPQSSNLVMARRRGDRFERDPDSEKIFRNVNSVALEYAPCISKDAKRLYFTRWDSKTRGALPELYVTERAATDAPFDVPRKIVAAAGLVEGPTLSPDERTLYYHKKVGANHVLFAIQRR